MHSDEPPYHGRGRTMSVHPRGSRHTLAQPSSQPLDTLLPPSFRQTGAKDTHWNLRAHRASQTTYTVPSGLPDNTVAPSGLSDNTVAPSGLPDKRWHPAVYQKTRWHPAVYRTNGGTQRSTGQQVPSGLPNNRYPAVYQTNGGTQRSPGQQGIQRSTRQHGGTQRTTRQTVAPSCLPDNRYPAVSRTTAV